MIIKILLITALWVGALAYLVWRLGSADRDCGDCDLLHCQHCHPDEY